MKNTCDNDAQGLLLGATVAALQISQDMNAEQTALLAAFLVTVGDQLALLALGKE